jgi:hypothetical protein
MMLPAMEAHRLREQWAESSRPGLLTGPLLGTADAARMRAFVDDNAPPERWLAHRGRYTELAEHEFPEVVRRCRSIAESIAATELPVEWVRLRRYRPGDYQLPADAPAPASRTVELILDLSERPATGGELVYCASHRPYFVVSHRPCALAMVERRPDTTRYVRYLPKTGATGAVYRLELALLLG